MERRGTRRERPHIVKGKNVSLEPYKILLVEMVSFSLMHGQYR